MDCGFFVGKWHTARPYRFRAKPRLRSSRAKCTAACFMDALAVTAAAGTGTWENDFAKHRGNMDIPR